MPHNWYGQNQDRNVRHTVHRSRRYTYTLQIQTSPGLMSVPKVRDRFAMTDSRNKCAHTKAHTQGGNNNPGTTETSGGGLSREDAAVEE